MATLKKSFVPVVLLALGGCLQFGSDDEYSGAAVDAGILTFVSQTTGIHFPHGTEGLEYVYRGSGIDDALYLKVAIPEGKKDEFLKNPIFQQENDNPKLSNMTLDKAWWEPSSLKDPLHKDMTINGNEFLGCSVGEAGGQLIAYVHWFDT